MNKALFLLLSFYVFACQKHPEGYNLKQDMPKGEFTGNDTIPEAETDYIFVTTAATVEGDTIHKS